MPYFRLLRPHQWVKNIFVFAGLIFGKKHTDPHAILWTILGFFCLSFVSSFIYVLNDIKDRNEDRQHPRKCNRPIASGAVSVPTALGIGILVGVVGLAGSVFLGSFKFVLLLLVYIAIQFGYTFGLKKVVLLDVIIIAIGFVLRAVSGAVLIDVEFSVWLVLCTFTLCLFLGFSKRQCELTALANAGETNVAKHRKTLTRYTPDLLNHMTTVSAGIAIISFMLYATDDRTVREFGTHWLAYTIPIVVYAVFRFALLVAHGRVDGPTDVVIRDRPFQMAVVLWAVTAILVINYGKTISEQLDKDTPRSQPSAQIAEDTKKAPAP